MLTSIPGITEKSPESLPGTLEPADADNRIPSLIITIGVPPSLAAVMDHNRSCIDVHFGGSIYSLFAQAYTVSEIDDLLPGNLAMTSSYTCPTVAPIIPPSVLADPSVYERQKAMDISLAGTANQGAYLLVTGRKS